MSTVEKREITAELQDSYLDYAMSVIVARALPDVRDGLKPVQRRILWDMWDSGLTYAARFRKSANVIGQVLARYHPHGDVAVYDAMVRMAQDFSLRYPLILGQGNFGSLDGDAAAAYRYTEAKLSKLSEEILADIDKETVDWTPNYDGTRTEPKVLPAKLPNLVLNGTVGIAVGMATNIPPHNLSEVVDAILHLLDHPGATVKDVTSFIKGPDFPTGGVIFDTKGIEQAYATGRGPITTRARSEIKERKAKQFDIVITEIPYQVNKSELVKKIAELVQDKKVEGIRDLRDESDREGLRIVVELRNDVPPQKILNQLYRHTDLQKDFHLNMIALVDGLQPQLMSLKDILAAYLDHRKIVVRRRCEFDLKRAKDRAHILEGLVKALSAIDRVIATIKRSKDKEEAKVNLIKLFKLTEVQAVAILEMRLQALASLERQKVEDELKEKRALIKELEAILKSPARISQIIKDELRELKEKYGKEGRRTEVVAAGLKEMRDEDLIPQEEAVITFSAGGYIKRLPPGTFKVQKRGGKGLIGSEVGEDDILTHFFAARTHDNVLFFTNRGRVFQTKVYDIPPATRTSKGKAIQNFLELPAEEGISAIVAYADTGKVESRKAKGGVDKESQSLPPPPSPLPQFLVMVTKDGLVKKTSLEDFKNIRRNGIIAINLKKGDLLKGAKLSTGKDQVFLTSAQGQSIRFLESAIRPMGRGAAGVKALRLRKGDTVAGFDIVPKEIAARSDAKMLTVMSGGYGKQTPLKEYKVQGRGGSGVKAAGVTPKTGQIIASCIITDHTTLLALSAKGQVIKTDLKSVRTAGRVAQGVRIMNLKSGDKVAGVVVV
jgi:DNA gyrase subunit A